MPVRLDAGTFGLKTEAMILKIALEMKPGNSLILLAGDSGVVVQKVADGNMVSSDAVLPGIPTKPDTKRSFEEIEAEDLASKAREDLRATLSKIPNNGPKDLLFYLFLGFG